MDYNYGGGDQYNTSYGANGGGQGGGFVDGDVQSSPSGAGGKGGYGKDTVRPLTVLQVLEAHQPHPDAEFKVDGETISQITFVGKILSISTQTTNVTYKVDDGTGIVEVKQWIDSDASSDNMDLDSKPKLSEDGYCRVWGRLKAFNNKRHVGAHVIRPITDMNEINYHLLEATAVHLFITRGPPPTAGQKTEGANGGVKQQYTAGGNILPQMTGSARRVYTTLKESSQSNEGLHVQMIASMLGMPVPEVYKASTELLGNGVIFTTVDDDTWAVLDV